MKNKLIITSTVLLFFTLGIWVGYLIFQEKIQYTIPILTVRVCNFSEKNIENISLGIEHRGPNYSNIQNGKCSEYIDSPALLSHLAMTITTQEESGRNRYNYILYDTMSVPYLLPGKYTVNITDIMVTEKKTTEYKGGIIYDLQRDGIFDNPYIF